MIPTSGTLAERVATLLRVHATETKGKQRNIYRWVDPPGPVMLREVESEGEASVEITLPVGCKCIDLWLPTGLFHFLAYDKNADGAFLLVLPDGSLEAHIGECKRTVDNEKWKKALLQMQWTLIKLTALAGALGEQLAGAVFYTAFRRDNLSEEESPNPATAERIVGDAETAAEADLTADRQKQLAWMRDRIRLSGFTQPFVHHKIRLDTAGRAGATLAVGAR